MRRHACVRPPLLSASTCDVLRSGGRQTRVACILGEIVYMGTEQFRILQWCVRQDKEARHGRFFCLLAECVGGLHPLRKQEDHAAPVTCVVSGGAYISSGSSDCTGIVSDALEAVRVQVSTHTRTRARKIAI